MDGSTVEYSDSDSGESWTLLDNQPAYGDVAPDFSENAPTAIERDHTEAHLDEDTDGISIISDSEPESPCNISCNKCSISENQPKTSQDIIPHNTTPQKKTIELICDEDDFLGDGSHKHKTYVHRRNQRLSMVLNIIMLGSVITAAGVAVGHMWGAKNECTGPTPSVNKILSNLLKLQEENAYLRNRVKELTLANKIHEIPKHNEAKKTKQHRCKKIFEEPLNNKAERAFKCLDDSNDVKILDNSDLLVHEKEFLNDIGKLKRVYNQNKSWLDDHIQRRFDHEHKIRNKRNIKGDFLPERGNPEKKVETFILPNLEEHDENNTPDKELRIPETNRRTKSHKAWTLKKQSHAPKNKENDKIKPTKDTESHNMIEKQTELNKDITSSESFETISSNAVTKEKKISYADSLRTNSDNQKHERNDDIELPITGVRGYNIKKKHGDVDLMLNLISSSEEDINIKDNRYIGPKMKRIKKQDRHKLHKKQKRKNKYEQWEMNGGYMKDFDDFSLTSSQVNLGSDFIITPEKKYLNHDFENYMAKLTETNEKPKQADVNKYKHLEKKEKGKKGKVKDPEWYQKRYALRTEARRKLEQELFGETSSNNAAGWYFRRMNKREQCRAQKDNSTFKKFSKQKLNFKMKH